LDANQRYEEGEMRAMAMGTDRGLDQVLSAISAPLQKRQQAEKACDEIGVAINNETLGDIVANHEKLILHYYSDVQDQANNSFDTAKWIAITGFAVLICTLLFVLGINLYKPPTGDISPLRSVGGVGILSGILIEFIAGVAFWLYSRCARQFSAFHICLERTHRYLIAYMMVERLGANKDETLRDLVCIMANAPMITQSDIDQYQAAPRIPRPVADPPSR
jgi:hypothetical protein